MPRASFAVLIVASLVVAGCSQSANTVTRGAPLAGPGAVGAGYAHAGADMVVQTQTLEKLSRDVLRKSTLTGAGMGALAGCGLAAASGSGANKCLGGAVAGGAVGALVGHAAGKAKVQKRVEIVELSKVMPTVSSAGKQMALVKSNLPDVLAQQDAELRRLDAALANGSLSKDAHSAKVDEIRQARVQMAQALTLTASQAKDAHAALKSADEQGQPGMAWYLLKTRALEDDAVSAREQISLL